MQKKPSSANGSLTAGMKWLLLAASALVFIIGLPLFLLPGQTDTLFAWTVNPPLTAAFLGAAYLSSFVLEFFSARQPTWAQARLAVPAVLLFTILTLVATVLHLDKFHFGSSFGLVTRAVTWVWLLVYATVPVIMAVLLLWQIRRAGSHRSPQAPLPGWLRLAFILQAAVMILVGLALFIVPRQSAELLWPWMLTPLTGRAVGAWLVGVGVAAAHFAWENDWWRVGTGTITYTVFAGLELIALWRFAQSYYQDSRQPVVDWNDPRAWVYLLFLISILAVGAYAWWAGKGAVGRAPHA